MEEDRVISNDLEGAMGGFHSIYEREEGVWWDFVCVCEEGVLFYNIHVAACGYWDRE